LFGPNTATRSSSSLTRAFVVGDTASDAPFPDLDYRPPATGVVRRVTLYGCGPVHRCFLTFVFRSLARCIVVREK